MKKELFCVDGIPAALYGDAADSVFLFIHGKNGCKEEAEDFARSACKKGWQALGIDLPEHGARKAEKGFDPWRVVPELQGLMHFARGRWQRVGLRANSIGAWFSMLAFAGEPIERCLFVSPILDMERLIADMMQWAGVSEAQLLERQEIPTAFGETLSWEYLEFAKRHPIKQWDSPTAVLYAGRDNLTARATVEAFTQKFHCSLSVMEDGEHWFHTPSQRNTLQRWENAEIPCVADKNPAGR